MQQQDKCLLMHMKSPGIMQRLFNRSSSVPAQLTLYIWQTLILKVTCYQHHVLSDRRFSDELLSEAESVICGGLTDHYPAALLSSFERESGLFRG
jgi:hypothetical protein